MEEKQKLPGQSKASWPSSLQFPRWQTSMALGRAPIPILPKEIHLQALGTASILSSLIQQVPGLRDPRDQGRGLWHPATAERKGELLTRLVYATASRSKRYVIHWLPVSLQSAGARLHGSLLGIDMDTYLCSPQHAGHSNISTFHGKSWAGKVTLWWEWRAYWVSLWDNKSEASKALVTEPTAKSTETGLFQACWLRSARTLGGKKQTQLGNCWA